MSRICTFIALSLCVASTAFGQLRSFASLALAEPWWEMGKTTFEETTGAYQLIRELPNMDSQTVDSFEALLNAETTLSNPKIDAQTYTGTFANSKVELLKQDDRGVTVRQTLTLLQALGGSSASNLAALDYRQMDENEIQDVFDFGTGEGDTRGLQWSSINPANRATLMAISDASLVSQFASDYTYENRKYEEQDDGTAKFSLLFRKIVWATWDDNTACDYYEYNNAGTANPREQIIMSWVGIRIADAKDAVDALRTGDAGGINGYTITAVRLQNRRNGAIDLSQVSRVHNTNGTTLTDSELIDPHSLCSGTMNRTTIIYSGYATANALPVSDYTLGVDDVISIKPVGPDGEGLFGLEIVIETTTWTAWSGNTKTSYDFIRQKLKDRDIEERTKIWCGIQSTDKSSAETALWTTNFTDEGFMVVVVDSTDNRNGSISLTQVQVEMDVEGAVTTKRISEFSTQTSATDVNQRDAVTHATNQTPGSIVSTRASLNSSGLWDNESHTDTASKTTQSTTEIDGPLQTSSSTIVINDDNKVAKSELVADIVTVRNVKNEYGLWDTTIEGRDGVARSGAQITYGGPIVEKKLIVSRNQNTVPTVGAGAAGVINDASYSINEFGLYDTRESVRTAQAYTGTESLAGGAVSTERVTVYRNQASLPSVTAGEAGTINSLSYSINEFGYYDARKAIRESVDVDSPDITYGNHFQTTVVTVHRNQEDPLSPGEPDEGEITGAANSINEYGRYDGRETTVTALARTLAEHTASVSEYGTTKIEKMYNAATMGAGSSSDATEVTVSGNLNAMGRYDYTKKTWTATSPGGYAYYTWSRDLKTVIFTDMSGYADGKYFVRYKFKHDVSYHNTESSAATAISEYLNGSSISRVAPRLWKATAVSYAGYNVEGSASSGPPAGGG